MHCTLALFSVIAKYTESRGRHSSSGLTSLLCRSEASEDLIPSKNCSARTFDSKIVQEIVNNLRDVARMKTQLSSYRYSHTKTEVGRIFDFVAPQASCLKCAG
jgi:hypothetical protein